MTAEGKFLQRLDWAGHTALICMVAACLAIGKTALAADPQQAPGDFANKSIEELMNIDVTTAGRKQQKLSKTPAAIYVVTREAIQRSGATNIPDILRMVPGVQVAQVEVNRWAVSVRGFNGVYANKLLVMVDNRTVYTPAFSGVYWDQLLAIPLDTIERIEVVRGPGGTVWGANAVNGVINIITSSSTETKGTTVTTGAGSSQRAHAETMFGGALSKSATYRVYGQFDNFSAARIPGGAIGHDRLNFESGGLRVDQVVSPRDSYLLNGSFFNSDGSADLRQMYPISTGETAAPMLNQGFDVTARWTRKHSDNSESSLQIYDTHYVRTDTFVRERSNALDFDFQNHTRVGSRNDLVWGAGFRETDSIGTSVNREAALQAVGYFAGFKPQGMKQTLVSGFMQDEISLSRTLSLTAGVKVEHTTFTGLEYEPSLRLGWSVTDASFVWLAASEADRQPSLLDELLDVHYVPIPVAPNLALALAFQGNRHFQPERVRDYEVGYRIIPIERLSLDFTGFYSRFSDLENVALLTPSLSFGSAGANLNLPFQYQNGGSAIDYGAEMVAVWNVAPRWKLTGSYAWLRMDVRAPSLATAESMGLPGGALPGSAQLLSSFQPNKSIGDAISPRHQSGVQSYVDVSRRLTLDGAFYYVSRLPEAPVPSYLRVDAHASYKLTRFVSMSVAGQNLFSPHHVEMDDTSQGISTEAGRSIFGKLVWTF